MRRTLLALAGLLVVAAVGARARGDDGAPTAGAPPAETVEAVDAAWAALETPTAADLRRFLGRYRAAQGGTEKARTLAERIVRDVDPSDPASRAVLGHREFRAEIPEEIAFRRYPFVRIVEEAALWKLPAAERAAAWGALDRRRAALRPYLVEKARIYTQVYRRFLATFGEACGLADLMAPWGGRPDLPIGKRSYREGRPLVVWVFADPATWSRHHERLPDVFIDSATVGYVRDGRAFVTDRAPTDRTEEIATHARLAVRQLLDAFWGQKNEWARPWPTETWIRSGLTSWLSSVRMKPDRSLVPTHTNVVLHERLVELQEHFAKSNKQLPVFPLYELTRFEGIHNVQAWGVRNWRMDPGSVAWLFEIQAWAFVRFLAEANGGARKHVIPRLLDEAIFSSTRDEEGLVGRTTSKALGMQLRDDWKPLQTEFEAHYRELATKRPPADDGPPPARDDWPGYVDPELEGPTGK
jgi:hypothetical protein